jgi:hypothetical protein
MSDYVPVPFPHQLMRNGTSNQDMYGLYLEQGYQMSYDTLVRPMLYDSGLGFFVVLTVMVTVALMAWRLAGFSSARDSGATLVGPQDEVTEIAPGVTRTHLAEPIANDLWDNPGRVH